MYVVFVRFRTDSKLFEIRVVSAKDSQSLRFIIEANEFKQITMLMISVAKYRTHWGSYWPPVSVPPYHANVLIASTEISNDTFGCSSPILSRFSLISTMTVCKRCHVSFLSRLRTMPHANYLTFDIYFVWPSILIRLLSACAARRCEECSVSYQQQSIGVLPDHTDIGLNSSYKNSPSPFRKKN